MSIPDPDFFTHLGSQISDPESRIQQQQQKEEEKDNISCLSLFCGCKFTKFKFKSSQLAAKSVL